MIARLTSVFRAIRLGCNLWLRHRAEVRQYNSWRIDNE